MTENCEDPWPVHKMQGVADIDIEGSRPAVLLASGPFNPVTETHLEALRLARERLEAAGYLILGGWLSPWSDSTVQTRSQSGSCLSSALRLRLATAAASELDWLAVSGWEAGHGGSVTHGKLATQLRKALAERLPEYLSVQTPCSVFMVSCDEILPPGRGLLASDGQGTITVPNGTDVVLEKTTSLAYLTWPMDCWYENFPEESVLRALRGRDCCFVQKAMPAGAAQLLLSRTQEDDAGIRKEIASLSAEVEPEGPWPADKVMTLMQDIGDNQPVAFLVATGSMDPVHLGHISMMWQAKARLERAGYRVAGSWLSICSDFQAKANSSRRGLAPLSKEMRHHVAKLAVLGDSLSSVASWQMEEETRSVRYVEVMLALRKAMVERFPLTLSLHHVHVFLVCGEEVLSQRGQLQPIAQHPELGAVIIPRDPDDIIMENVTSQIFEGEAAADQALPSISCEAVRRHLASRDIASFVKWMAPAAARFLSAPTRSERQRFASDFEVLGVPAEKGFPGGTMHLKARLKDSFQLWQGPLGTISVQDLQHLLQMLDPSWTQVQVDTLVCALAKSKPGAQTTYEDLIDWIFRDAA